MPQSFVQHVSHLEGKSPEMDAGKHDEYLGVIEVARMLGVSPKTVARWGDQGLIPGMVTQGRHRRFPRNAVDGVRQDMYGPPAVAAQDEADDEDTT